VPHDGDVVAGEAEVLDLLVLAARDAVLAVQHDLLIRVRAQGKVDRLDGRGVFGVPVGNSVVALVASSICGRGVLRVCTATVRAVGGRFAAFALPIVRVAIRVGLQKGEKKMRSGAQRIKTQTQKQRNLFVISHWFA